MPASTLSAVSTPSCWFLPDIRDTLYHGGLRRCLEDFFFLPSPFSSKVLQKRLFGVGFFFCFCLLVHSFKGPVEVHGSLAYAFQMSPRYSLMFERAVTKCSKIFGTILWKSLQHVLCTSLPTTLNSTYSKFSLLSLLTRNWGALTCQSHTLINPKMFITDVFLLILTRKKF